MRAAGLVIALAALAGEAAAQDVLSYTSRLKFSNWTKDLQTAYVMGVADGIGSSQALGQDSNLHLSLRRCLYTKTIDAEQIRRTTVSVIDRAPEILNEPASFAVTEAVALICDVTLPKW